MAIRSEEERERSNDMEKDSRNAVEIIRKERGE